MNLTSKQRAYLKGLAADMDPILQIGKSGVSPETVESLDQIFNTHELIKAAVLKNCMEDVRMVADKLSSRTHSDVVHVIGHRIVLYKPFQENPVIVLPRAPKKKDI